MELDARLQVEDVLHTVWRDVPLFGQRGLHVRAAGLVLDQAFEDGRVGDEAFLGIHGRWVEPVRVACEEKRQGIGRGGGGLGRGRGGWCCGWRRSRLGRGGCSWSSRRRRSWGGGWLRCSRRGTGRGGRWCSGAARGEKAHTGCDAGQAEKSTAGERRRAHA